MAYANPPRCLVGRVLRQEKGQQARVILVAPVWKDQPWHPVLLEKLWDFPQWIPLFQNLFLMTSETVAMSYQPQLAVWPISGENLPVKTFQAKLGISSWLLGEQSSTRLMIPISMASWRTKSNKTCDSHFKKWLCWCSARGSDPISGPVSEVANVLADLHEEGYQSSSLNVFRSAILSVHDKVDGVEIGKHPTVTHLLKGAFCERPPLPWYTYIYLGCEQSFTIFKEFGSF